MSKSLKPVEPRVIADYACECGENPLWHPDERRLYWTDIPTGRLFRYDPATGEHACFYEDRPVGGFTFQADGSLLLFRDKGNVVVWRDGGVAATVIDELPDEVASRFNDVCADPLGGVYCGTMPTPDRKGRLYHLHRDGSIGLLLEDIGCSNGMGYSPDLQSFYYTDSTAKAIYTFDLHADTAELSNQRVFVDTTDVHAGVPDGMTTSASGEVFSATWGASAVVRYGLDGAEIERYTLPVPNITSLCFATLADGRHTAYATSAMGQKKDELGPDAGATFELPLGVAGGPEFRSRVGMG
ncbi:MAG: SMP-30/gluconolactonase/LRE family protein [Planctomycetota bacterium]